MYGFDRCMWLILSIASAFFLGVYDVYKKLGLTRNAVIPVLFLNTIFCSLFFMPLLLLSRYAPDAMRNSVFNVPSVDAHIHAQIFLKSIIVLVSWGTGYLAVKHLPLTLIGPIKSLQPAFVLMGALAVFAEKLNYWQFAGIAVSIVCFFLYSMVGRREGISFWSNRWVWFLFVAVITGAASGLYDKYLLGKYDKMAVLIWCNMYQIVLMLPILFLFWFPRRRVSAPFEFRKSIIGISFFLCISDFLYFYALSFPDAMISVVSVVRRSGMVISFVGGVLVFHDKNVKVKTLILLGVLVGIFLLYMGSVK